MGCKGEDRMLNGFGLRRRAWSGRVGLELSELGELRPPKPALKMTNRFWDGLMAICH